MAHTNLPFLSSQIASLLTVAHSRHCAVCIYSTCASDQPSCNAVNGGHDIPLRSIIKGTPTARTNDSMQYRKMFRSKSLTIFQSYPYCLGCHKIALTVRSLLESKSFFPTGLSVHSSCLLIPRFDNPGITRNVIVMAVLRGI